MEPMHIAIGFYKNKRHYLSIDPFGRIVATDDYTKAQPMEKPVAAVAALLASVKFNLAHCRAVSVDEAQNAEPI